MPTYFPENNTPLALDTEVRSLQKINDLLRGGISLSLSSSGISADSFDRLRVSNPQTLFDSSHRYQANNLWVTSTAVGGSANFNATKGLVELVVNQTTGSSVLRETTKVFAYQPGKSLLVMNSFVFSPAKTNLRQRVGYFNSDNGYYLELNDSTLNLVERSLSIGATTAVPRSNWNGDKLDGSGASGLTLDITKAQILWMDFEWLGVGSVRCGFIINGNFIVCHTFHHANLIGSTYTTTACLPLRYEITNTGTTSGSSTLSQVCSTVISEGGYQLNGGGKSFATAVGTPYNMATSATYYPIVSLRLKSDRLDGIVIPTGMSLLPAATGNYHWRIVSNGTTTGGTWVADNNAEYNITGTSFTGGTVLSSGFISQSNQSNPSASLSRDSLFKYQLERNSFTSTPYELTLAVACQTVGGGGNTIFGSIDVEEITR